MTKNDAQFTSIWNDFLFGVIITSRPAVRPITVALNNMAGSYIVEWNVQMAGPILNRPSDALGVHFPGPLLHAGITGRIAEGVMLF